MAESTLAISYADLRKAIGHFVYGEVDPDNLDADELVAVDMIIKDGLNQFYMAGDWNFLKPTASITTVAPYSTGTIAVAITGTTVTLTDGVWPSWAATNGTLVVDSTEYAIASRTDDTHIELSSAWTETTETAAEYVLNHDGNYDLPDDYADMEGSMVFHSKNYPDIVKVGEGHLTNLRNRDTSLSYPRFVAIRPKDFTDATAGQRFEIRLWPVPDAAYVLDYKKVILPNMLVDTTAEYPYGGAIHGLTIKASCMAMAESQEDENVGIWQKKYETFLANSIRLDMKTNQADYFGYNGDRSGGQNGVSRHNRGFTINYNGEIY